MVGTAPEVGTFPPALSEAVEDSAATFFCGSCGMTHAPDAGDAPEEEAEPAPGIMSTISFMGDHQWAFALAFPHRAAESIARAFAGFDIPFDSADMGDVVGEIVNVIAGDVVGRLAKKGIEAKMSLPTTVRGRDVAMLVPTDATTTRFSFTGPQGVCRFNLIATPAADGNPLVAAVEADALTVTPPPVSSPTAPVLPAPAAADPAADAWAAAMAEAERELAAQDAAEAAARAAGLTPGAAPAEAAPARKSRSGLLYLALAAAAAGWGAFALVLTRERPAAPAEVAPESEGAKAEVEPPPPLDRIDELALGGKFEDGLRACFDAPKAAKPPRPTALALREGLCLEGMGRWAEAADMYARAADDADPVIGAVALLGQARCAAQDGSYLLARALANRALLRSGVPGGHGPAIAADARYLKAQATAAEAGRLVLSRDATVRKMLSRNPTNGLAWVRRDAPPAAPRPGGDVFEVHRTLDGPRALKVSAVLGQRASADVVRMAAATAGLTLEATEPALARLNWAVGPIEADHLTLAEFLNVLTEDTGVVWELKPDALVLRKAK